MFESQKTIAVKSIAESIEQYCRMRMQSDKIIIGVFADIQNSISRIAGEQERKLLCRSRIMIKGFVRPDGTFLKSNRIIEGPNRTAAMMCYEMGLLLGVNEKSVCVQNKNGKETPVAIHFVLKSQEPDEPEPEKPFETTDINDIPDGPEPSAETDRPAEPEPESQNAAENHTGAGVQPQN